MDYRIVSAESRLSEFLADAGFQSKDFVRLPSDIEDAVKIAAVTLSTQNGDESIGTSSVVGRLVVRTSLLSGPAGRCLAVTLEELRRRDPIASAGKRFRLSKREREVLSLIIMGYEAREIAERLGIAESTVGEYFKHLNEKVGARNRSAMLAEIFAPLEARLS
jgi:DNA-binding CsgD family transcriptional regulator